MAVTRTVSGSLTLTAAIQQALTGDYAGGGSASLSISEVFGASDITVTGFLKGTFIAAAGDLLLAHATDPLGGMGDATYSDGFVPSGTHKLKCLIIINNDATNTVGVARAAVNGLPIFDAAGDKMTLGANGGALVFLLPAGTAVLTTGTNDALTISVSGGTPSCTIFAVYGT